MRRKRNNTHIFARCLFTCLLCYPTSRVAATSRVTGSGVTSSDIGDSTGDHYLVLDDPDVAYDIDFDKAYDVDFFLLGGGGGGGRNRGGGGDRVLLLFSWITG